MIKIKFSGNIVITKIKGKQKNLTLHLWLFKILRLYLRIINGSHLKCK